MLIQAAEKYYFDMDYNCAESVLSAANEVYGLGLGKDAHRLLGGFGGGIGCGSLCGALAGAIAVLGAVYIEERAHASQGFRERCAAFAAAFERELGSQMCAQVKPVHADPTGKRRCFAPVEAACRLLKEELDAVRA